VLVKQQINNQKINNFEYIILILLSLLGILLLCCSNDLMTAYLAIELQSLSFYIMASFKRTSTFSVESGLKYFIIGSFASSLFLFGSSLIYGLTGSLNFEDFKDLFFWLTPGSIFILQNIDVYYEKLDSETLLNGIIYKFFVNNQKDFSDYLSKNDVEFLVEEINKFSMFKEGTQNDLFRQLSLSFKYKNYLLISETSTHDLSFSLKTYQSLLNAEFILSLILIDVCFLDSMPHQANPDNVVSNALNTLNIIFLLPEFASNADYQESVLLDNSFNLNLMYIALLFILISLLTKLALVPFHLWLPDVYEGSPTSTSMFFAIIPKLGILVLLIRLFYYSFAYYIDHYQYYIIIIAVLSVLVGSFSGLEQRKLKSLLAYSSIGHMGYSLLAFNSGTFEGIQMLYFYMIIYMIAGICLWSMLIFFKQKTKYIKKNSKDLSDLSLLNKSNSVAAFIFSIVLLSIAGFPPFIGFFVKMGVFLVAIESSMYLSSIIIILCSVLSTFYYIRIIKIIYFEQKLTGKLYYPLESNVIIILNFFFFALIYLFINPTLLYLITYKINLLFYV